MPFVRDTENVDETVDYAPSGKHTHKRTQEIETLIADAWITDEFEWLSIMMYDSRADSGPKDRPVMVRADNHQEWGRNYFISPGDGERYCTLHMPGEVVADSKM